MQTHSLSHAYKCKQTNTHVNSGKDFSHWRERKEEQLRFLFVNVQMASCCDSSASSWQRCLRVFPVFYLLLPWDVVWQYSKADLMSGCYCRGSPASLLPLSQLPLYQHLSRSILQRASLAEKYFLFFSFLFFFFFFKYRLAFSCFRPSKSWSWPGGGWEGPGRAGSGRACGRELAHIIIVIIISSGLQPWGSLGTAPRQPSLGSVNPGGKPAAKPFRQPGRIFLGHLRRALRGCL